MSAWHSEPFPAFEPYTKKILWSSFVNIPYSFSRAGCNAENPKPEREPLHGARPRAPCTRVRTGTRSPYRRSYRTQRSAFYRDRGDRTRRRRRTGPEHRTGRFCALRCMWGFSSRSCLGSWIDRARGALSTPGPLKTKSLLVEHAEHAGTPQAHRTPGRLPRCSGLSGFYRAAPRA